jgi:3,4-dihydroxy 2-butanone 4-phosphate synthase/GTP cyclohydrolase II
MTKTRPSSRRRPSPRPARRPALKFSAVEDAVEAIRKGGMVIVVDDEDRENEGDLTIAAEKITPTAINFMMTHGRGLICMPMTPERLDALEIPLQVPPGRNTTPFDTAFCVGIEARPSRPRPSRPISPARVTSFRCARATAASWCGPARPKRPSTWRGPPGSTRPG